MFCRHNLDPFFRLFVLHLLICNSGFATAADQENGKSFEQNLKDFANMAESLAGGLKTVAKAAKFISGESDFDNGETEECSFVCKNGATPRRKIGYIPEDNGCGAYGLKVDLSKLPEMEQCCTKHDRCYGQCGKEKDLCDVKFSQCLEGVCNNLLKTMGLTDEESEGCMMTVQLMYLTVMELGCQAYLDAQKEACVCQRHSDDNRTGHTGRFKTRVEL